VKYRVIKTRLVQLKDGKSVERVGEVFDGADVEKYVSPKELVRRGFIEPIDDEKVTKEVLEAPVRKPLGRPRKAR
jgi:hypothetical protein